MENHVIFVSVVSKILKLNPYEPGYIYKMINNDYTPCDIEFDELPPFKGQTVNIGCKTPRVKYKIYKNHLETGIKNESVIIDHMRRDGTIVHSKQHSYVVPICDGLELFGQIDGLTTVTGKNGQKKHVLVEIKIRRQRGGLRPWEMVQIQLYLYLTEADVCMFIDVVNGYMCRTCITRDDEYITAILNNLKKLKPFPAA